MVERIARDLVGDRPGASRLVQQKGRMVEVVFCMREVARVVACIPCCLVARVAALTLLLGLLN